MNNLTVLAPATFACARTCTPGLECLFGPLLRQIGPTRVVSHTTRIAIQLTDRAALAIAVENMGGVVLPGNTHRLYAGSEIGFGFRLPKWRYPLVLRADNTLAYDDYHGAWGSVADIKKLTGAYAIAKAQIAANGMGWTSEVLPDGNLLIHHPEGGSIHVNADGTVDANGFVGVGCDVTTAIENALGQQVERTNKSDYFIEENYLHRG